MKDLSAQDPRLRELERWIAEDLGFDHATIAPASSDASFRRYFRLMRGGESFIAMDAPPARENVGPYLRIAALLAGIGLNVPRVLACDADRGFVLLSDLGSRLYLAEFADPGRAPSLIRDALAALLRMQTAGTALAAARLPPYDREVLMGEMRLFPEWFLGKHLQVEIDAAARAMLDRLFGALVRNAIEQPHTLVHRDYHSRNLMVTAEDNPGILDFQDALYGPVTYDLVSLLKDCYIVWPRAQVHDWALGHRDRLRDHGFALPHADASFLRWFDLMGMQRHLKVLGIFCRLHYRDGKGQYLLDLPRVLDYVRETAGAYPEAAEFAGYLAGRVEPAFGAAQGRVSG
ncbi:MAG TPA: phosphotransferase [Steroidobacteraceae bacterium]|nr:phosphotransferase [Steroidobacteraceae bacterium]